MTSRLPRPCTGGVVTVDGDHVRCSERWPDADPRLAWCAQCECNLLDARLASAMARLQAIEEALTAPEVSR